MEDRLTLRGYSVAPGIAGAFRSFARGRALHPPVALLATILFAGFCMTFVSLRPLLPIDETRYLAVAWEMWLGGSKLVPHLNGALYGHKPPLLFWLIHGVWSATGVSELAARLVAPAFGAASVALAAVLARRLWPRTRARAGRAALILASSGAFLLYGSSVMFDTMLTTAVLLAVMALWRLGGRADAGGAIALGAAVTLGIYAKGPVMLVHVLPVALLAPFWRDPDADWSLSRYLRSLGIALLVAAALVGVWLLPALVAGGPEYRQDVLWRQEVGRMVNAFAHHRPWYWFVALLPFYLWPWGWSRAAWRSLLPRTLMADRATRFVALWMLSALIGFSLISGKQAHYLLPELPALALLLSREVPDGDRLWRLVLVLPAVTLVSLGAAVMAGLIAVPDVPAAAIPLTAMAAACVIVALLAAAARRLPGGVALMVCVAPLTLLALHLLAAPYLWRTADPGRIAGLMAAHEAAGLAIQAGSYQGQFSFAGRLTAPLDVLPDTAAVAAWAKAHPGGVVASSRDLAMPGMVAIARERLQDRVYTLYQAPTTGP